MANPFDEMRPGAELGWTGYFTRYEYPGAYKNGTRVVKSATEEGDAHPIGSVGTILGSMSHPEMFPRVGYFVEWDAHPRIACFTASTKIQERGE